MDGSVTAVVVSYNTVEKLRRCLKALEGVPTVVVDNDSKDGSPEMVRHEFPFVEMIANRENRGFSAANNQGLALVRTPLTLFINSDAYADPGAVATLAAVFEGAGVVAAGGRLRNPDGSLQESVARELTLGRVFLEQTLLEKVFGGYWITRGLTGIAKVPQVMGACLMARTADLREIGGWDERFFLYCEDTDLCLRLSPKGSILWVEGAGFEHELGSSSRREPWRGIARYNRGKELFFRIHRGGLASIVCAGLNKLGALIRLVLKPKQAKTWWKVLAIRPD
ncbi:glycosyltransferase family 2 protein [bacterium]|nr:MAG: glycosyltransferase family 2 protein [bacterium]